MAHLDSYESRRESDFQKTAETEQEFSTNTAFSLFFLSTMSIAEDKTHHMVNFPELASKINIQLMINRWVKIMMQKPESIRPY